MSLKSKYQAFLASPSASALAENASLHYITTLTSIHDATPIIKHFTVQEKLLKKKEQKVLSAVEGGNALSVDVETTIEFIAGGGAYLPGLDDNFVADRTVSFPMVHIVHFDSEQKIVQIRKYWDQGSLLKSLEVIGARAKNWPIRDGRDQSRLIASSDAVVAQPGSAASSRRSTAARGADEVSIRERPIRSRGSTTNAMNDPHASLSLFEARNVDQEHTSPSRPTVARAASAKPPPRDLGDLFVGENRGSPSPANAQSAFETRPVKSGGGKNFRSNRLFEETEEEMAAPTPMSVKTNAKKYNHFEFGEGEEATPKAAERPSVKSKHASQWDFADFVTPEKIKPKILGQAVRHFGWSDDEDEGSPVRREVIHKARPDADPHFEFEDDGTPDAERKEAMAKARMQHKGNKGMGLYQDHVLGSTSDDEDSASKGDTKRPLNDVTTHIKNDNRTKDFGAHWDMTDDSPGLDKGSNGSKANKLPVSRKATATNWEHYQDSPESRGINVAGNGMGGRKGTETSWSLFDESPQQAKKENLGIKSMGNGMGGRKGTGFDWDF